MSPTHWNVILHQMAPTFYIMRACFRARAQPISRRLRPGRWIRASCKTNLKNAL